MTLHNKGLVKLKMYNVNISESEDTEKFRADEALEHLEKAKEIYDAKIKYNNTLPTDSSLSEPGNDIVNKKLTRLEGDIMFAKCKVDDNRTDIQCDSLRKDIYSSTDLFNNNIFDGYKIQS